VAPRSSVHVNCFIPSSQPASWDEIIAVRNQATLELIAEVLTASFSEDVAAQEIKSSVGGIPLRNQLNCSASFGKQWANKILNGRFLKKKKKSV
jgi:hypothetical protein